MATEKRAAESGPPRAEEKGAKFAEGEEKRRAGPPRAEDKGARSPRAEEKRATDTKAEVKSASPF